MSLTSVSIASRPKSAPPEPGSAASVYASSMNSTPPKAWVKSFVVLMAVAPTNSPTRSARAASTKCPERSTPSEPSSAP